MGNKDLSLPSGLPGGPLQEVIEATNNVIIAHGALDFVLLINGTLLTLQNLTWNGAQGFSEPPNQPFYVPFDQVHEEHTRGEIGAGFMGQWVRERGLTFCIVEASGHKVPRYQPAAAFRHLEVLLGRVAGLDETR